MSKGAENFIPFLIVGVILLVRVLRAAAAAQQRRNQPGSALGDDAEEGWEAWEPDQAQTTARPTGLPGQPRPPRQPSAKVRAILEALEQQTRQLEGTQRKPPPIPEAVPPKRPEETTPPPRPVGEFRSQVPDEMGEPAGAAAFPEAGLMAPTLRGERRRHGPIRVVAKGRPALRQGILLSEILGPPRAFDQ